MWRQLVGVKLHRQAVPAGGREDPRHLLGRERDALAEGVDRIRQARGRDRRDHVAAHQVDIGVGPPAVLLGDRVGPEERRAHPHG